MVAVLIAVSVVALAIVLVKLYQFRSLRIGDRRFIGPALDAHRRGVEETLRKMLEQKLREQGAAPAAPAGR